MVNYQKPEITVERFARVDVVLASSEPTQPPTEKPTIPYTDWGYEVP